MNTQVCDTPISDYKDKNIYPHDSLVTRQYRNHKTGHHSGVVLLTWLSGAGKSTIATRVEQRMFNRNYLISILDGDTVRTGLNTDLNFDEKSRAENLRRTGEVANLFANVGHIVLASFISPHHQGRQTVKNIIGDHFYLVHINADIDDCIERDPKGLYKKAASGGIKNFTGISQTYEIPENPDLVINTSKNNIDSCTNELITFIENKFSILNASNLNMNELIQQCQKL